MKQEKKRSLLHRIGDYLWSLFLNGLLTILPIALTLAIFHISLKLLTSWLEPIRAWQPEFLAWIPFSEIILAIVIIFVIGTILKLFMFRSIVHAFEHFFSHMPLIRPIYNGIKQLVRAFGPHDEYTFKKVVMIEFPRKGVYSLGFLTSELKKELSPNQNETFLNIFVPTTPNPTSGYYVAIAESQVKMTKLSRQEAMALIISGGIIQPNHVNEQDN